jgi:hypothetical protein
VKHYPTITKEIRHDLFIYAFNKIDGSNIRAEWNSKRGFYKFGTRNQLTNEKEMPFGRSIPLLRDKYEADLAAVFKEQGWKDAICFFEYWGADSFAGNHNFEAPMDITLIDVNPYKKGILPPAKFIELFGHLDIPTICYQGYVSTELFDQVKQSMLPGMTFEGVVCKGEEDGRPVMFKVKSRAWLDKLREFCHGDGGLFERLS